jgi:Tetracyclin repressor-like, C-terminal domain
VESVYFIMETTKASRKKTSKQTSAYTIAEKYKHTLLLAGKEPISIYKFCLDEGVTEADFYEHFNSFASIECFIWKNFVASTEQQLIADEAFASFSAREKILTFYFALAETLKANRSYVLVKAAHFKKTDLSPNFLKDFKHSFEKFTESVLTEAINKGEVAKRPYLDKRYPQLFWIHMSLFLVYWKDDTSTGFEKSDVFIEKSVNLAFDLISKGAIDSAIDFTKFLFQTTFKN